MLKKPTVKPCKLPMLNCLHYLKMPAWLTAIYPAGFSTGLINSKEFENQIIGYTSLRGWNESSN